MPDTVFQHAQLRAKVDAGLRHVHSVMLGQGDVRQADALAQLDDVVAAAADADPALHLGVAVSGTVQWAESRDAAVLEVAAMRRHGLLNQPHFLETPHEIALQQSKFAWYTDAGALGPDLVFGHFIQTNEEILQAAAAAGCGMSWQPMSNGRLASGVAQIPISGSWASRWGSGWTTPSCTERRATRRTTSATSLACCGPIPATLPRCPSATSWSCHPQLGRAAGPGRGRRRLRPGRYADFLVVRPAAARHRAGTGRMGTYRAGTLAAQPVARCGSSGRQVADGDRLCNPQSPAVEDQVQSGWPGCGQGRAAATVAAAPAVLDGIAGAAPEVARRR